MKLDLPPALIDALKSGQIILFLGSGASVSTVNSLGKHPPIGNGLSDLLSENFLGARHNGRNLNYVSALAISETDIFKVQTYIRDIFKDFKPSQSHLQIPSFKWRAIFTTNYDTIIEDAYQEAGKKSVQRISPLISNNDIFDRVVSDPSIVPYFKLHGCITKVRDPASLLILTIEQYITYRKGRDHLFEQFDNWAKEYPIVFIGHGLEDTDIREALLRLDDLVDRPRSYLISRQKSDEEKRFWERSKITAINGTFDDFVETISSEIPAPFRGILADFSTEHPIERKYLNDQKISKRINDFLEKDVDYLHSNIKTENHSIESFYRGFDLGWFSIEKNLDIKRDLLETLLWSVILIGDSARPSKVDFYVIKASAGAGKTVLLRRLAWETGIEANQISLYLKDTGTLKYEVLYEIFINTKERIFLFVNNASEHIKEIEEIILKSRKDNLLLTIIASERNNEWNMNCDSLDKLISQSYDLPYLSKSEILELLRKLEQYDLLNHLKNLTQEERIKSLEKQSGRQLLVALHEVTLGKKFEDIIVDEYNEIKPRLAQYLYLTICTLNRYRIPVRAGLISRMYGIKFTDFHQKFFGPLEEVVQTIDDKTFGDFGYRARHPQIAEIVFLRVLSKSEDRFAEYAKVFQALNISYSVDLLAFKKLLNAKALLDLFTDYTMIGELFKIAMKIEPESSYVFHQRGVYEMNRDNGNFTKSNEYLQRAKKINSKDNTITHSLAELALKRATHATTELEKEKFRREAEKICVGLLKDSFTRRHARNTLVKISLERLQEGLDLHNITDPEIDDLVHEIEKYVETGLQENGQDSRLLFLESQFRGILKNKQRALTALEKAFDANKRDPYVAIRLSKAYEHSDINAALNVIREALEANPGNPNLHFALATMLKKIDSNDHDTLIYHFKRGFSPKDQNYDAQFWYAYYLYVKGDEIGIEESNQIFRFLREAPMPFEARMKIKCYLEENNEPIIFNGRLKNKKILFGYIEREGVGDSIFVHQKDNSKESWQSLNETDRVSFNVGFNFSGPIALNVALLK